MKNWQFFLLLSLNVAGFGYTFWFLGKTNDWSYRVEERLKNNEKSISDAREFEYKMKKAVSQLHKEQEVITDKYRLEESEKIHQEIEEKKAERERTLWKFLGMLF